MEKTLALVALVVMGIAFSTGVYADGMIIPEPMPPHPHPTMLEVKYHHVDVTIDNQFTDTNIDQKFHNPNSWDIEGTYLFPLPDGASIQRFSMFVNGEELQGEVLEAGEARRIYENLVRKMIDPGLLEYVSRNTFKARVYPIEANSDKRVTLDYSEVISCENGICEYVYPLDTERFSSKDLEDVVINVKIKSNVAIKSVYSPSHEIEVKRISDNEVEVSYEDEEVKPDTDFKLIYTISEDDLGVNLLTHKDGNTGYFMLMLAPKFAESSQVVNKDIVFVLDKSGSMAGEKIEQAKDALKFCLNNLNMGDHFGIVTFSTGVSAYKDELETVNTGGVDEAIDFVDDIKALGGTDIESALLEALDMLHSEDRPQIIVFLSDGEPTVGVTDINSIIEDVTDQNREEAKLFIFGIGYDVNTFLLDKLAMDNHGVADYVVEGENIEVKVSNFYEKIDNPVLSNVELSITGVDAGEMYPKTVPDIFKGTQILVLGQYTKSGVGEIKISGDIAGVENTLRYSRDFPSEEESNDFLPRLWATRKVGYLLEQIRLEGEDDELIDEVIALAKKYGIATPYTSFLILEDEPNWANTRQALAPMTGESAVNASQDLGGYKSAGAAGPGEAEITGPGGETTTIKYVGSKTFIERDGVLTDTEYAEGSATKNLKYGSDAYFQALADNPRLGEYFAIGKDLIVCVSGVCIKVRESYGGAEDTIGDLNIGGAAGAQCRSDSDCTLTCACTCASPTEGNVLCVRAMDCPNEAGITGCKCQSGICVQVTDPNWEPEQPPVTPATVCGNGLCESGEGSLSCPADCALQPGPITRPSAGQDNSMMLLVAGVIIAVLAGLLVMRIGKKGKAKKIPKLPAEKAGTKAKTKK